MSPWSNPLLRLLPAWTGTARPRGWPGFSMTWWLPVTRTTRKPRRSNARTACFPLTLGSLGIDFDPVLALPGFQRFRAVGPRDRSAGVQIVADEGFQAGPDVRQCLRLRLPLADGPGE